MVMNAIRNLQSAICNPQSAIASFRILLAFALLFIAGAARAELADQECLKCHGEPWMASMRPDALPAMVRIPPGEAPIHRNPDDITKLYIAQDAFKGSAHAGLNCTQCHQGIERLPHNQRLAWLSCDDCHSEVSKALAEGIHKPGGDGKAKPACTDCHGSAHEILPVGAKRTHKQAEQMALACMRCHGDSNGLAHDAKDKNSKAADAQLKTVSVGSVTVVSNKPEHLAGGSHTSGSDNPAHSYRDNVHGKALFEKGLGLSATCADCHGSHTILPPSDPKSTVNPQQAPKTCGRCHQGIAEVYYTSIHGQNLLKGKTNAATCTSCHGSHGIGAINEAFTLGVIQECSNCHLKLGKTYLKSYHGKATSLGSGAAAVCSSCHGSHDILPASDPKSRVAPANLTQTCGRCHERANQNFVKYLPHVDYKDPKSSMPVFIVWLGMNLLLLSVLAVFIPHGILWFQRTLVERFHNPQGYHMRPHHERRIARFHWVHRVTHALIIVSFMGLVATGFPLKYSDTGWAKAIAGMMGGAHVMGIIHRLLALVTFSYVAIHVAFLIWFFTKKCPRPIWKYLIGPDSLIFSLRDLKDFIAMVRWFFWLGPRPKFDRWVYFEKFDYWGELWGCFLIGGTGLMLWMPTLFTRWLPGWVLNCATVIHSIEALLAASVIFLVHFFNTHLRPEKFPIDMVMLTGQMTEDEMKDERPAEYERLVAEGKLEERIVPPVPFYLRAIGAVLGMIAFLTGIILIALALKTEISQFFH